MRKASLMNSSLLAIAAMLVGASSQAVRAQSFNATAGVVAGSVAIDVATPGQTTVTLNTPVAVIDWRTNEPAGGSGPIIFQPLGTTATYINGDASNFTVLNRILPNDATRPVQFNGTVLSRLRDFPSPPAPVTITRGGTLFFYSPGGILVGSTGVFDVGSLVLTSSDLSYNPSTGDFGSAGTYSFLPANPGSSVEVRAGAQITASQFNSYVALVAPKVVNAGTITVDGSAVLVAADASTITFRPNGLFDIQIDQGTSATGEVVTNTGTITGAAGSGNTAHRVYVVAVPKNDAITLAIKGGSKLGFDIAGAADVDGNAIVLSAGYDIGGGNIGGVRSAGGGTGKAALTIGAIEGTSQVTGRATGAASIQVLGGADASFASNVSIAGTFDPGSESADGAFVSVSGVGSTLDITGDFAVTSLDAGIVLGTGVTDSGVARIAVNRGTMTVDGNVQVSASRIGFNNLDAVGGEASFLATNGASVTIGQALTVTADGTGLGVNDSVSIGSFPGVGGTAQVSVAGGATVGIAGNLKLSAAGFGGAVDGSGFAGANGTGGSALLEGLLGTLTVTGTTLLDARGVGAAGFSCVSCSVEGGFGTGGVASLSTANGTRFEFGQAVVVDASGLGGAAIVDGGKAGGAAVGGEASLKSFGGAIIANAGASVLADGTGGAGAFTDSFASGFPGSGGEGGDGIGGTATLSAGADLDLVQSGSIAVTGDTLVSANGTGANGGAGGTGIGGRASVSARHGTITGAGLSNRALGLGGSGYNSGAGGAGLGGIAEVIAYSAVDGDSSVTFGTTAVTARGSGGAGSAPEFLTAPGGAGGAGSGGVVSALAEAGNGKLQLGATTLNASGNGGAGGDGAAFGGIPNTGENGGAGGVGRGGFAQFGVVSGAETGAVNTGTASFAGAAVGANGTGGTGGAASAADVTPGVAGQGGNAFGGGATLVVNGGTVTLSAAAQVQAGALGGGGGGGLGAGGSAFVGGTVGGDGVLVPSGARLEVGSRAGHADQLGTLTGTALTFSATAEAGKGGSVAGATNLGRPLAFLVDGGTITADSLDFQAAGIEVPGALPSAIALARGDTTIAGTFNFATPGTLTAALGGAELFSATTVISASSWLAGPVPAETPGTLHGSTSVSLLSGGDLFANLSVESGGNLTLSATGLIRLDNLTAADLVLAEAGTTLSLGNVDAGTTVTLTAVGNATVGTVDAEGGVVLSADGAFSAGAISSRQSIVVDGATGITLGGDVAAGSAVTLVSDGAISGAGVSAGVVSPSPVSGASYDITVFGKGAITLGNLAAAHDIKLFTPQDLTVGAVTGRDLAVLARGKQTIGFFAATGRVLLADYEMTLSGGDPLGAYDLNALFAALPIAAGGTITVLGNSSAGSLIATSASDLTAQALTATGAIDLQSGGALSTRAIDAGGSIAAAATATMNLASADAGDLLFLTGGEITTGALAGTNGVSITGLAGVTTGTVDSIAGTIGVTATGDLATAGVTANGAIGLATSGGNLTTTGAVRAGSSVDLTASGTISAAAITAGQSVRVDGTTGIGLSGDTVAGDAILLVSDGAITGKGLSAGLVSPSGASGATYEITVFGQGNVALEALSAASDIKLFTPGALTVGALSGREIAVLTGGNQIIGSIAATGRVLLAGYAMTPIGGDPVDAYDLEALFGAKPVASGGSISVLAATSAGSLTAHSLSDISAKAITTARTLFPVGSVDLRAGGALTTGAIVTAGRLDAGAGTTMDLASASSEDFLVLNAGGAITTGNLVGGGGVSVTGLDAVTTGTVQSGNGANLSVSADGALNLVSATSDSVLVLEAGGALSAGDISGDTVTVSGDASVTLGAVNSVTGVGLTAAGDLRAGDVFGGDAATLVSTAGGVTTGDLGSFAGSISVTATGPVALGAVRAATGIAIDAGTSLALGGAATDNGDVVLDATGGITAGNLGAANGILRVTAGGAATLGDLFAFGVSGAAGLRIAAGTTLDMGTAAAETGELRLTSGGAMTTGDLTTNGGVLTVISSGAFAARALTGHDGIAVTSSGNAALTGLAGSAAGDVVFGVTGTLTTRAMTAAGRIGLTATGAISTGDLSATGALAVSGTALALGNLAGSSVGIAAAATLGTGTVTARTGDAVLDAAGDLAAGGITASGAVRLTSTGGDLAAGAITAGGAITATAPGTMALGTAKAGDLLTLSSGGILTAGDLDGASGVVVTGLGAVTTGGVQSANGGAALTAAGDLASGAVSARGPVVLISTGGGVTAGNLASASSTAALTAAGAASAGTVTAASGIVAGSKSNLTLGAATSSAGDIVLDATGALTTGNLDAAGGRLLLSAGGAVDLGDLAAAGVADGVGLRVASGTTLALGTAAVNAGELRLTSGGAMTAGDLTAIGGALTLTSGGALAAQALSGRDGIALSANGNTQLTGAVTSSAGAVTLVVAGTLDAQTISADAGLVRITTAGPATTGALTAATTLVASSDGALVTGNLRAASVSAAAATTLQTGTVTASSGAAALSAGSDLTAGRISATDAVSLASSGGAVTGQAIDAGGNLSLTAAGDLQAGALTAGGNLDVAGAKVTLGNLRAAGVNVGASNALTFGIVDAAAGDAGFSANGALRGGAITAAGSIKMTGLAPVTTGDLTAGNSVLVRAGGDAALGAARGGFGTVELRSEGGSLAVGAITAGTDTALAAANDLAVGDINARDMLLLAGGTVRASSLTSPGGRILVASNALAVLGGPVGEFNFDPVFAAPLQSTGGTLAVTGGISAGAFTAAVGGDAALLGVQATRSVLVDAGGTVRLAGVLQAPLIELRANDLSMPSGSGLDAGLTGTINLVSRNAAGMRIGDGLDDSVIPANGYTLDNAEWGRINSGSLSVFGLSVPGQGGNGQGGNGPVSMLIGKLDVTGPDAGSTIDDPSGTVRFRTGASPAASASGTIRVTGALTAQGFRAGNTLAFETGQFQLASDTGSVAVLGQADALSGTLRIEARDIHVATAPLLARMAADPFFAGLEAALDTESAGGSQPVLRAGALDLTVGRTLYIQRTGTGSDPLGFDDPLDGFQVTRSGQSQITVIINGTFRTADGVVGGIPAWQLFKDSGVDLSGFTADSRLNGCLLSAATCGVVPQPQPQPDPDPGFRTLIEVLGDPALADTAPDDPDKPERKVSNAILPPQTVLPVQPDALPVQIDEPIAGSGNAALIGAAIGMNGALGQ